MFVVAEVTEALSANEDSDGDGIADADEGYSDSDGDGIPDYADNNSDTSVLPVGDGTQVLQTEPGLKLKLGKTAIASSALNANSATLDLDALADFGGEGGTSSDNTTDEAFVPVSDIVDFEIEQLPRAGASVSIVIPMPEGSTLLKMPFIVSTIATMGGVTSLRMVRMPSLQVRWWMVFVQVLQLKAIPMA